MTQDRINLDTDTILEKDAHLIQSFADLNFLKDKSARTVISKADGSRVCEHDGNELIDGIGGLWCVNIGHRRQEVISAINEQLNTLDYYSTFYNFTHPTAVQLAEKLVSLAPANLTRVHFGNSGSVANDSAVRILHHYYNRIGKPQKKKILSRQGAYHGSTYLAMAMTTPAYSDGWDCARDLVTHLRCPHALREANGATEAEFLDLLMTEMRDKIEEVGSENIAAFIAEPIMGAGGIIVAPEGYHKRAIELCRAYDIKYISDEVVTAFGRLGHMFASEDVFGIQPDMITTAKGLTSGYQPLSATLFTDEIYDVIAGEGAMFLHGMTYSGHPAASAAALANIKVLETEQIPQRVRTSGKRFENNLRALSDLDLVGDVRGSHFMMGIEFVKDKATNESYPDAAKVGLRAARHCQARGLIARALGNILILSPTLVLTDEEIDDIARILRESIIATRADLNMEGF